MQSSNSNRKIGALLVFIALFSIILFSPLTEAQTETTSTIWVTSVTTSTSNIIQTTTTTEWITLVTTSTSNIIQTTTQQFTTQILTTITLTQTIPTTTTFTEKVTNILTNIISTTTTFTEIVTSIPIVYLLGAALIVVIAALAYVLLFYSLRRK
jgi:hypothetical protein